MKVGDTYKTNKNGYLEVINYVNSDNITIAFVATGYQMITTAGRIRRGVVKDKMLPSVYGVGYIGSGEYEGIPHVYKVWKNMLSRCYCKKFLDKHPTYQGCSVSEDWHNFQNFAKWFEHNCKDGYQLDKDLLVVGNKVYSADTCIFLPRSLNTFTLGRAAGRGKYPIGVHYHKRGNNYRAACREGGALRRLGHFADPKLAHEAWKVYKSSLALGMKAEMDKIDGRIYPNVLTIINNME